MVKKILKTIFYVFLFIVLFICIQIPTLAEVPFPWETTYKFDIYNHVLLLLISVPIIFLLVYLYSSKLHNKLDFTKKITVKNVVIAIAAFIIQNIIQQILQPIVGTNGRIFTEILHTTLAPVEIITLCIISPVLEEMLFQGAIQKGMFRNMNAVFSVVTTSIIFVFCHGYGFSVTSLSLLAPAIAFAITYQLTDDIKMPIFCHGLSNLIALFLN